MECGVDPNCRINSGATALHGAVASGQLEIIKSLLSCGCSMTFATYKGELPLHTACRMGQLETTFILLSHKVLFNL